MKPIVVIDDDEDVRDVIIFALENEGYEVLSFENGREALSALNKLSPEELPAFIIVDYLMPEMNGVQFLGEIKRKYSKTLGKIPVALSSAMGEFDPALKDLENILQIPKPIDLGDLLRVVHQHGL